MDRYSPSIRVDHARMFIEVTSLLQQRRVPEAWEKFQQYASAFGDLGGALDAQLPGAPLPPSDIVVMDMPWGPANFRKALPTFSEPIAFRFTVTDGPKAVAGYSTIVEYQGDVALRQCSLSRVPGDFRPVDPSGNNGPMDYSQGAQASIIWNLPPGQYFYNVRNVQPGVWPALAETRWPQ